MDKLLIINESKYIKESVIDRLFPRISVAFFVALYVLPQYFGLPLPIFDLTILRIMILVMFVFFLGTSYNLRDFVRLVVAAPFSLVLVPYVAVLTYTTILRVDVNAFLNPAIELLSLYMLIYIIKNCFGVKKTLGYILVFSYILASLGLVEYVIQRSPFSYLETIHGLSAGRFIRSGYYRIMGPSIHSLGYGLMLITMLPVICYNFEKDEIYILKHKLLFIMITINIFLTGSRSTLSVFIIEVFMLALLSSRTNKKKLIINGSVYIGLLAVFLIVFHSTSLAQYVLLQITSVIDEIMGTAYSANYGADVKALGDSSNYREQLKYIFRVDWLNPLVGIGRKRSFACEINASYIKSVDSFYIAEYIRYAYPGLICYVIFILFFLIRMLKDCIRTKSQLIKMLFTGAFCYCINIFWLDSLQTLKYLYVLFAIYSCIPQNKKVEGLSIYIKQR